MLSVYDAGLRYKKVSLLLAIARRFELSFTQPVAVFKQ